MNTQQIAATAALTVVWLGALAFMPANADSLDSGPVPTTIVSAPLNASETAQHLTWDMTYGDRQPAPIVVADTPAT